MLTFVTNYNNGVSVSYGKEFSWSLYGSLGTTKFIKKEDIPNFLKKKLNQA